ncbi:MULTISPECIES: DNA-binding protein [Micromonospora]|uniref:DNA-binding protein n=1 Tax=Micromonospora sicca TaxID=2202420 RepID=A0A317D8M6_9ACTN|nr:MULTISPECIES: DNA-binding protein [unclassified Micromonospora]MBM0228878.1 DNA-binding protein [Micromonospora sp. ATA51]PWR11241.1 DNA-binding protein [Micromonospora sp. 4G51]
MTKKLRLVGSAEIRVLLGGVSRQRVYQITNRRDFPEPVAKLEMGNVWLAEDVEKWITEKRPEMD